jgi:hypothetical protein
MAFSRVCSSSTLQGETDLKSLETDWVKNTKIIKAVTSSSQDNMHCSRGGFSALGTIYSSFAVPVVFFFWG